MTLPDSAHFEVVTLMLARRRGEMSYDEHAEALVRVFDEAETPGELFRLIVGLGDLAAGGAIIAAGATGVEPEEIVQKSAALFAGD